MSVEVEHCLVQWTDLVEATSMSCLWYRSLFFRYAIIYVGLGFFLIKTSTLRVRVKVNAGGSGLAAYVLVYVPKLCTLHLGALACCVRPSNLWPQ